MRNNESRNMKGIRRLMAGCPLSIVGSLFLLAACSGEEEPPGTLAPQGATRVEFRLPGTLGATTGAGMTTKAADNLGPDNWHDLPEKTNPALLPVGSTLWMSCAKKNDDGTFDTPTLQGYVVGTNSGGYNSLYTCVSEENAEGKLEIQADRMGAPLYLENGTYKFKMISPAYPIDPDEMTLRVDNGMYLYATDGRYKETASVKTSIEVNPEGVQYIKLPPIISQVARFTFEIKKGNGVNTLEPLAAGIEISGLQDPYGEEGLAYNWCSENIADTLVMRMGDKRAYLRVPGGELRTDEETGTIAGDIGVLPTLTMSTPVSVLVNIAVNGVPTQYMTLVNEPMLLHARSYNLKWEISMEDGRVSVVTWQNQSWVTDLEEETR